MIKPPPTLICCAHGTRTPAGRRAIGSLVAAVRANAPELVVRTAFVDVQPPVLARIVPQVCAQGPAVVVPLLLSSGFHVGVDIAQATSGGLATAANPLGPDDRLTSLLLQRLREIGLADEDVLILAAAGSSRPESVPDIAAVATQLRAFHPGPVRIGYGASRAPLVPDAVAAARAEHPGRRVVLGSYLLAPGFFQRRLEQAGADLVSAALINGEPESLAPLVGIVMDRYAEALTLSG